MDTLYVGDQCWFWWRCPWIYRNNLVWNPVMIKTRDTGYIKCRFITVMTGDLNSHGTVQCLFYHILVPPISGWFKTEHKDDFDSYYVSDINYLACLEYLPSCVMMLEGDFMAEAGIATGAELGSNPLQVWSHMIHLASKCEVTWYIYLPGVKSHDSFSCIAFTNCSADWAEIFTENWP